MSQHNESAYSIMIYHICQLNDTIPVANHSSTYFIIESTGDFQTTERKKPDLVGIRTRVTWFKDEYSIYSTKVTGNISSTLKVIKLIGRYR